MTETHHESKPALLLREFVLSMAQSENFLKVQAHAQ